MRIWIIGAVTCFAISGVTGCASISETDCQIGAWAEYGYKDGLNGRSSDRIADYARKCGELGIQPDRQAYLESYDRGVVKYCTYERGYALGEDGSSYNQVCSGPLARDFAPGYDAGRVIYDIRQERKGLIDRYEDRMKHLKSVRERLNSPDLENDERERLRKKARRLEREADDIRVDIRAFERVHNLPRYDFY